MTSDIMSVVASLDLRVLLEFDEDYQAYVAHCLDTGAIATGQTIEESQSLIKQVLENDIQIAIRTKSLESLFHKTASPDVKSRWYEAKTAAPDNVRRVPLEISKDPLKRGVQSEFRIGKTKPSAA